MNSKTGQPTESSRLLCIVLGGGGGTGLFPLTRDRATPAMPLAGNFRVVDVPISNCISSGFRQIYVLTQFNSVSLHRHVEDAYTFDQFSDGFVEIRAAQQTFTDSSWYQGTADAVRKNLAHFQTREFEHALILSADHLYFQDFRALVAQHAATGADITIGTATVNRAEAPSLGILQIDDKCRVQRFVEKPADERLLDELRLTDKSPLVQGSVGGKETYLASMGIYVFTRNALEALLESHDADFGRDILPRATKSHQVHAYLFKGYWADLGAIRPYYEAHLDLVSDTPSFNFFDLARPIYTQPIYLPAAKINGATIDHALITAGCIINQAKISHCIIGLRSMIGSGSELRRVISFGCDYYETQESMAAHDKTGVPRIGIGRNARIEGAIIDKNARIGDNVTISPDGKPSVSDGENYFIRDGIVIIPRNAIIPHGTVI